MRALAGSPARRPLVVLAVGIVSVLLATVTGQVWLNRWQGAFYDALAQLDATRFAHELWVFLGLVAFLLALAVAQTWMHLVLKAVLREALTDDLFGEWLAPRRVYGLTLAGDIGVNPDQRVDEDARRLTELTADLGVGLLQATLLLGSFIGVLWILSAQVRLPLVGTAVAVPGYMVWCALAYAVAGSWLAQRVGRPLVALNAERYAREAELRYACVRIGELAEGIALYGGERDERRVLGRALGDVIAIMRQLAAGQARLTWVTGGYGWGALVFPILVAAPGYFAGTLTFGGLMMVVGAFNQVQQSLRWYVDNYAAIADWRATLLRVMAFREALTGLDGADCAPLRIRYTEDGERLVIDALTVHMANCSIALDVPRLEVAPGDRVLIEGSPGSGKSTFFRALAGLWPWGKGCVGLPPRSRIVFLPHRPHFPRGSLVTALAYPSEPGQRGQADFVLALERVGLARLVPMLGRTERWERELTLDEQQRLVVARLLLQRPGWIVHDEALSSIGDEGLEAVRSVFARELAGTAVIGIGHATFGGGADGRVVHLVRNGELPGSPRRPAGPP